MLAFSGSVNEPCPVRPVSYHCSFTEALLLSIVVTRWWRRRATYQVADTLLSGISRGVASTFRLSKISPALFVQPKRARLCCAFFRPEVGIFDVGVWWRTSFIYVVSRTHLEHSCSRGGREIDVLHLHRAVLQGVKKHQGSSRLGGAVSAHHQ